jgi:hypothetical protein
MMKVFIAMIAYCIANTAMKPIQTKTIETIVATTTAA